MCICNPRLRTLWCGKPGCECPLKAEPELAWFEALSEANAARQAEWDAGNQLTLAYRGNEMAGEVGEACNVIKKIERERMGIRGSRDTVDHLMEELADVIICAYLCAMSVGGNLDRAVAEKFNKTSEANELKTRLVVPFP